MVKQTIVHNAGLTADASSIGILALVWTNILPTVTSALTLAWMAFRLYREIILWKENRAEKRKKTKKRK